MVRKNFEQAASASKLPKNFSLQKQLDIFGTEADMTSKCPTVYIKTFGCQMNTRDSELIYGLLTKEGYKKATSAEEADVVLINTCSVRKHAEDRAWSEIGRIKKPTVHSPQSMDHGLSSVDRKPIIGIIGCMAQSHKEKIFKRFPHVDFICGPANIYEIPGLIKMSGNGKTHLAALDKKERPDIEQPAYRQNAYSAYVSISEGCNNFCSYCIVPYVRGRQKSRSEGLILDEVRKLADSGYKEVTLLGQNVNSYRIQNHKRKYDFVDLLNEINKVDGIEKINFMTSHPKDTSPRLFKAMRDLKKVSKHLHLPLQSGSNKILKRMKRGYAKEKYLKLVEDFRKIVPGSSISTDIIVGFPGEKEKDFKDTYDIMKKVEFDNAFIFKYSPRAPAKSSEYRDDVPKKTKEERHQVLLEFQKKISKRKRKEKNLIKHEKN